MNDLEFAIQFARERGDEIVALRCSTGRHKKLDRTDVTDADVGVNIRFIEEVTRREGPQTSVHGEERSYKGSGDRLWVIDPIDGTGEYVDDSISDSLRTTCIGISLLANWKPVLSVVNNPFRKELFTVTDNTPTLLNGRIAQCSKTSTTNVPYDYAHWDGAAHDLPRLEATFGKRLGAHSAIYQACMVATGQSEFAAFAGSTIHDIAPAALLVQQAGGVVTDFHARQLSWRSLKPGVLYANNKSRHSRVIEVLRQL